MFRSLLLSSVATLALTVGAQASTFGLENSIGATLPFSVTSGGVTATFSSVAGNGFAVQSTSGLLTFDTALLDNNFFGTDPLTITFSSPVTGNVAIPFAFLDAFGTTDALTLTTNTGQALSFLAAPDSLILGEPEGMVNFALLAPATSFALTGPTAFAIGDVSVAATPEPTSIVLLATGAAGVFLRRRRTA